MADSSIILNEIIGSNECVLLRIRRFFHFFFVGIGEKKIKLKGTGQMKGVQCNQGNVGSLNT